MAEDRTGSAQDAGRSTVADDDESVIGGLKKRLAETTARLESQTKITNAERTARGAAEREAGQAKASTLSANELAATNAVQAYEREAAGLEQDLEDAMTNGAAKDVAKATRALATCQGNLNEAKRAADYYKNAREAAAKAPAPGPALMDGEDPRLAPYAKWPATKEWIKGHPQFFNDSKFFNRTVAFHTLAVEEGIQIDSPEYFEFIEENLGLRKQDRRQQKEEDFEDPRSEAREVRPSTGTRELTFADGDEDPEPRRMPRRDATSTAAPTGRRGVSADIDDDRGGSSGRRVTAEDNEGAQISDPELYAKDPRKAVDNYLDQKRVLLREGRIGGRATRH